MKSTTWIGLQNHATCGKKFYYDCIKNGTTQEYCSLFDFSNCSAESKYYDNSEKLVVDKVKHETGGATVK